MSDENRETITTVEITPMGEAYSAWLSGASEAERHSSMAAFSAGYRARDDEVDALRSELERWQKGQP